MKRLFGLFVLLSLLVLAACSDTTPEVTAPDDAASVGGFRFDLDASSQQINVTTVHTQSLQTQQTGEQRLLNPGTELALGSVNISQSGNVVTFEATFENVTSSLSFAQPFAFRPLFTPQRGNYLSSTEPAVTDEELGEDGVLSPGESFTVSFQVTGKGNGEGFTYFVNAFAVVEGRDAEGCGDDGVVEGDVLIQLQKDVDLLAGCTRIEGSLVVRTGAQTLDFSPLDSLQAVTEDFRIENSPSLTSVAGFNNLKTVATTFNETTNSPSEFTINNNFSLTTVSGFGTLKSAGGLNFTRNAALVTIPEFGALEELGRFLIFDNDALVSFSGFGKLESVGSSDSFFTIEDNDVLVSFSGFESLRLVGSNAPGGRGGFFQIARNFSLVSIPEFGNLEMVLGGDPSVGGRTLLDISGNNSLPTISGFGKLERIEDGTLFLGFNNSLTSISGFESLTFVDSDFRTGFVTITANLSLTSISGLTLIGDAEAEDPTTGQDFVSIRIDNNDVFDCSVPPQSNLPFLPIDASFSNLVNCPTK